MKNIFKNKNIDKEFLNALQEIEKEYYTGYENSHEKNYFLQQKHRYTKLYDIFKSILNKNDKILDVGCYPSHFTLCLKKIGYNIIGVDKNPKRNLKFTLDKHLEIKKCNIEKNVLPFKNETFDKILFVEVFEHLYTNPIFALNEIKRVLKKEGKLILATPNGYSLKRIIYFLSGRGLGEDPFEGFETYKLIGHYGHIREYSVRELKIFLKNIGFTMEKIDFVYYGHYKFRNHPLISSSLRLFYNMFYFFRPHLMIIASKSKWKN